MAAKRKVSGPKPFTIYIVVATDDLKALDKGDFTEVEVVGSGVTQAAAVEDANGNLAGDAEGANMALVTVDIVAAWPLVTESKLVL